VSKGSSSASSSLKTTQMGPEDLLVKKSPECERMSSMGSVTLMLKEAKVEKEEENLVKIYRYHGTNEPVLKGLGQMQGSIYSWSSTVIRVPIPGWSMMFDRLHDQGLLRIFCDHARPAT
jgi:hypothetical protein